ncbi:MAG: 30S ribosomal protein S2 [Caldilineaceae bacterium]|nr:30S ribosomal protein S2 [Caldilineaceae bacterium]MCY4118098.1 30S ribosomal protein S2 [Caldilineaceae bacterium]MDE0072092.1 30S ribosomal protein S2 [Caldilineaceae bacterium]MDE0183083.1 30S ribosomal protein S2 [Caldilineaceae bacterium]MDE0431680.1 30S ribosomal protein S2 [Caldilineaceae bacterium]
MASVVTMKQLLEAGVHFGHRTRRWNPKMRQYIFTERSGIHIIDLHQTMTRINEYYEMVRRLVAGGGTVLFVGTKRQAQGTIEQEAARCGMPYIHNRWLGGTLTNWATIKQRIDYLNRQERRKSNGEFQSLPKIEQLVIDRELAKLNRRIGGIKTLNEMPNLIFVIDTIREELAVKEANKIGIPLIAVTDTNSDPDKITYIIPGNDDAIRSVKLITQIVADAVEEGRRFREVDMVETGQVSEDELAELEQYLGPSTLAKLQGMEDEEGATEGAAAATEADAAEMSTDAVEAEQQPAEAEAPLVDGVEEAEQTESTEQTDAEPVGEEG